MFDILIVLAFSRLITRKMKAGKQTQAQYPSFDVYDCSIISLIL